MSLQNKTLQRYRQLFPQETLRETSHRTGIQITRVFRLMNGKTMKVGELEAFETLINSKIAENPHFNRFQSLVEESYALLTDIELSKIADYFERKIVNKKYGKVQSHSTFQEFNIA